MESEIIMGLVKTIEDISSTLNEVKTIMEQQRDIMQRQVIAKKEMAKKEVGKVASFDGFITYYNLTPLLSFDDQPFDVMYQMYVKVCPLGKFEPITPNRFSRLVHKIGYRTVAKTIKGKSVRVFERSNNT